MQNPIPVILLHGALGSAKQFDSITSQLNHNFNVHVLNFNGHGGLAIPLDSPAGQTQDKHFLAMSGRPAGQTKDKHSLAMEGRFSLEMFRNDILKYMDENKIKAAHLFGYSMGGYVAISLASEFPDRVHSILTLATKFDWTESTAAGEIKMLNPSIMIQKVPKFAEILKQRHAPENWEIVVNKTSEFIADLGLHPLSENDFRNVKCPVRIMVGDRDNMVSVTESQNVYKMFSSGSLVVLPETPHPFESVNENRLMFEFESFFI